MCSAFEEVGVDYFEQSGDICRLFSWMKLNKKETSFPYEEQTLLNGLEF